MTSATHSGFSLPPPHLLLFELVSASAAIGCTPSRSWIRLATLPVLSACSYCIIRDGALYMRPRWASLLGGFSVAVLLRYIDVGLISRWNFENKGPASSSSTVDAATRTKTSIASSSSGTLLARFQYGWYTLWSFRQVNTPYEVKNVPRFSSTESHYVPPRWRFVLQQAVSAMTCYLVLDLLGQRPPPSNPSQLFNPALIPIFSRLHEVTLSELKRRALTITGFAATFFLIIQGFQSFAAALAVGIGLSPVGSWRPAFGSILDAYSLKNVWGKFWHQLLRRPLTAPATYFVHDVLKMPRHSLPAGALTLVSSFALSGVLHTAAGVASGMPADQLGVFRFFCTQALGVMVEQGGMALFRKAKKRDVSSEHSNERPAWCVRIVGYAWVVAFMTWTGPSWIYPQAARASAQGATAFLPLSIIGWLKG